MKQCLRSLFVLGVICTFACCDRPAPPAAEVSRADADLEKTQAELSTARDALQRQALEIDTRTALMDKQLAEMAKALQERENAELRSSLDALRKQNDDLRSQADTARIQSSIIAQKTAPLPHISTNATTAAPRDYSLFYDQLSSYGRWFDVSGYGYCWRPTIMTPRWRPYLDGCWAWSSLGWTWQSNEPFGWIVYHYGRWVNLSRYGWVWVPGCDWAPAWVAWRQSSDYVGWAPLPPDSGPCGGVYRDCDSYYNLGPASYTFISINLFTRPSYASICTPVTYNTSIFQSSVNVTQIVRCDDRPDAHVFKHHGGPPRAQMEQACARQVQQVQVQTASAEQIPPHRPGYHREPRAAQPVIIDLPAANLGVKPVRPQISERIDKPKRVDAFEGMPQRVANDIRHTIAEEKATAVAQQQPVAADAPSRFAHRPERASESVGAPVPNETVRPAVAFEHKPAPLPMPPVAAHEAPPTSTNRDSSDRVNGRRHRDPDSARPEHMLLVQRPSEPSQTAAPEVVSGAEPEKTTPQAKVMPAPAIVAEPPPVVTAPVPSVVDETTPLQASAAEKTAADPAAEAQRQQQEAQQRAAAEKMAAEQQTAAAEAEKSRMQAAEQAQAAAVQQKQQEEQAVQQRSIADKMVAEQAQAAADPVRQQAETAAMERQQEEQAAQQRALAEKMAAEQAQAAADAERVRQQAEVAAMQQRQQEEQAAQQRAVAEKMAAEQAQAAAAEAERVRLQAEVAARQRQQEEAVRRAQEAAQRQAEEQASRAAEERMRREQEMAQRRAEEVARLQAEAEMRRAQEAAQRQAEEQARRAAEEQMRRAQEMAQRQAEEAARRQAEEQMRRAQEEAQRAAQEAAQRAAQEAARSQPQPNPGS